LTLWSVSKTNTEDIKVDVGSVSEAHILDTLHQTLCSGGKTNTEDIKVDVVECKEDSIIDTVEYKEDTNTERLLLK